MSRMPRAGGRYVAPIVLPDGTTVSPEAPKGAYTLTAGTTYRYILGGPDAPFLSVQLTGLTAAAVVTSATIRDCNHHELEVLDNDTAAGAWIAEDPSTGFVGVDGTNWTVSNSVVAASGGGVGGAMWHLGETGAYRTCLEVVMGGTGGLFRVSCHSKD